MFMNKYPDVASTYREKSSGPKTEPWGTPASTFVCVNVFNLIMIKPTELEDCLK